MRAAILADERLATNRWPTDRGAVCAAGGACDVAPHARRASPAPKTAPGAAKLTSLVEPPEQDGGDAFADWLEQVAASADRQAYARLFAHFAPRVKGYLLRLSLPAAEAEEVCQEVMTTVWRKAASFDRRQASVATWIFRIARNRRIDVFRRDQRAQIDEYDPLFQPAPEVRPDEALETAGVDARLRLALAELPPEQLELVRAAFYEDLSHSQVAERAGLPLGTVKSRLRLAFIRLRRRLEADGAETIQP